MDEVTWAALALTLTLVGALYTWFAFRRRGVAAGLRGAAYTLLPGAAYLTDSLQMLTRIVDAVGDWALGLVFRPSVWAGVILAGLAVVLFVVSGFMRGRAVGRVRPGRRGDKPEQLSDAGDRPGLPKAHGATAPVDDDLADIEAILKKRGIT